MPAVRKYRRETSEISCCLKYLLFTSNVIIWLTALVVLSVGIWAWTEKDMFRNISKLTFIALDPAFVLIILGTITFMLGLMGSVGALRENTCLLSAVSYTKYCLPNIYYICIRIIHYLFTVCHISERSVVK